MDLAGVRAIIEVPSTALAGEDFLVKVSTVGTGCMSAESMDVSVGVSDADFTPFDRRRFPGGGEACTSNIRFFLHEGWVKFETPGTKTIRIHGRRQANRAEELVEITHTLTVQ
ncbi:MAG: hypothetical protein H0T46_02260 [Deltaproteobacteria bacterium]|nr:hypothetical protein [Deltaproteobacteria bacterium]